MHKYLEAHERHKAAAAQAYRLFVDHCGGIAPPRVPGMGTAIRLAWRIECGRTIEQAAAREYVYRWHLAVKAPDQCLPVSDRPRDRMPNACVSVFGAPHTIGL